jgi:hypothetical protein
VRGSSWKRTFAPNIRPTKKIPQSGPILTL